MTSTRSTVMAPGFPAPRVANPPRPLWYLLAIELAPPPVHPLEAWARRSEWQQAALVVALVLVPGAAAAFESARAQVPVVASGPTPASTHRRVRGVRPPRSC